MPKAAFINLQNKYSLYHIIESKTFEPEFFVWDEVDPNNLKNYSCVVYYSQTIDKEVLRSIRQNLYFFNIHLIIFTDSLDIQSKRDFIRAGADVVELLPENVDEFIVILKRASESLKNEDTINHHLLNIFKLSVTETFKTMALVEANFITAFKTSDKFYPAELTGILKLIDENKGSLMISLERPLLRKVISKIMSIPLESINDEAESDGLGELLNMISGIVKTGLSYTEFHYLASLPFTLKKEEVETVTTMGIPHVVIIFEVEGEYLAMCVFMSTFLAEGY